jgi:hypothetical protein
MPIAKKGLALRPKANDLVLGSTLTQLIVCPHHPDLLRRPAPRAGDLHADNLEYALTWNVFRTLELLPPAFWLRRLQARLQSAQSLQAAQIVRVELWRALSLPPAQQLVDPGRASPVADILIETEHTVWALMVRSDDWLEDHVSGTDPVARLIDAGSWFAGTRDFHFGFIVVNPERAPVATALVRRYGRSKNSLLLRSGSRAGSVMNVRGVGLTRWADLAAILRDCEQSPILSDIERALADNALAWLLRIGIVPMTGRSI